MTTQEAFKDSIDHRSDCTERAVRSLIYTIQIFHSRLCVSSSVSSSCNSSIFLANEKARSIYSVVKELHPFCILAYYIPRYTGPWTRRKYSKPKKEKK